MEILIIAIVAIILLYIFLLKKTIKKMATKTKPSRLQKKIPRYILAVIICAIYLTLINTLAFMIYDLMFENREPLMWETALYVFVSGTIAVSSTRAIWRKITGSAKKDKEPMQQENNEA